MSVCIATYNGSRFVSEQLRSILEQLPDDGEVVVVDDASTDDTVSTIRALADPRIRVSVQPVNRGYVRSFEKAISRAEGSAILLSDQDDVWAEGRLRILVEALHDSFVVASNLALFPDRAPLPTPLGGTGWRLHSEGSQHNIRNEIGVLAGAMPYFGCAMGISAAARSLILPFPDFLTESHDLWIALCGNAARSVRHLDDVTVLRRLHETNTSPSRPRDLRTVLRARWMLLKALAEAKRRARRYRRS